MQHIVCSSTKTAYQCTPKIAINAWYLESLPLHNCSAAQNSGCRGCPYHQQTTSSHSTHKIGSGTSDIHQVPRSSRSTLSTSSTIHQPSHHSQESAMPIFGRLQAVYSSGTVRSSYGCPDCCPRLSLQIMSSTPCMRIMSANTPGPRISQQSRKGSRQAWNGALLTRVDMRCRIAALPTVLATRLDLPCMKESSKSSYRVSLLSSRSSSAVCTRVEMDAKVCILLLGQVVGQKDPGMTLPQRARR